jgi:hypothetical protein
MADIIEQAQSIVGEALLHSRECDLADYTAAFHRADFTQMQRIMERAIDDPALEWMILQFHLERNGDEAYDTARVQADIERIFRLFCDE